MASLTKITIPFNCIYSIQAKLHFTYMQRFFLPHGDYEKVSFCSFCHGWQKVWTSVVFPEKFCSFFLTVFPVNKYTMQTNRTLSVATLMNISLSHLFCMLCNAFMSDIYNLKQICLLHKIIKKKNVKNCSHL